METTCPICFEDLEGKVKASPNTCDHVFCLSCLEKWSKLGSFCPVDRKRFTKIINLESESSIQIKPRKRKRRKPVYDFSSKCEICSRDNHANVLLLCDCCDLAFHLFCLTPPLETVPAGLWFCPTCISVEAKIKQKSGITKEVEADFGNVNLQLEEREGHSDVKTILTTGRRQNSVEEPFNGRKEQKSEIFKNVESIDKQCANSVESSSNSEFQDLNVERNCCQETFSCSSNFSDSDNVRVETKSCRFESKKISKTYGKHENQQREILKMPSLDEMYNVKPVNTSIHDMCLKNNTLKEISLLDDCLYKVVGYGEMKIGLEEEDANDVYMTGVDRDVSGLKEEDANNVSNTRVESDFDETCENKKTYSKMKCVHEKDSGLSFNSRFRKKVHEITSPNKSNSQHHSTAIISQDNSHNSGTNIGSFLKQRIPESTVPVGMPSYVNNILPSCSSISVKSNKGTFNNLISGACAESYSERPSIEIIENKSVEGHEKEKIQFSVFERIEGNDASQKKYSAINSRACILFSSNLNISHCFSCKSMILSASPNYCKICKLEYFNNSSVNGKNSKCMKSSKQSQIFESLGDVNTGNKPFNFCNQRNTSKKLMSAVEKRHYSLQRKLQKIRNSKKKLTDPYQ